MLDDILVPINRAGWPFIILFAVVTAFFATFSDLLGWAGVILTLWCVYFFRDPDRVTPQREGLLISPADGIVLPIEKAPPPPELDMGTAPRTRISIFMNVFNVHVNRAPADGTVTALAYEPGKFFNASLDKASKDNERMSVRMTTTAGHDIAFVQIAGLVARRIICYLSEGDPIKAGSRFGLIRFGSRVDVFLPDGAQPLVLAGQTSVAGETVLADLGSLKASGKPAASGRKAPARAKSASSAAPLKKAGGGRKGARSTGASKTPARQAKSAAVRKRAPKASTKE